jgi:hypothetical protein
MSRFALMLVSLAFLTGCSGEREVGSDASGHDTAQLGAIASDLAIQKGMSLLCDREQPDHLSYFMADLRQESVDPAVRERIAEESVEMMNKISTEEPEYICTPEMFESADSRATEALIAWDEMRGITQ